MKVFSILLFTSIFLSHFQAQAQTGCIASGILLQPNGVMYMAYKSGSYDLYGAKNNNPYNTYCIVSTNSTCIVKGILGTYPGTEVLYSPLPCPIDTEVILLVSALAMYGFFKLSKEKLMLT